MTTDTLSRAFELVKPIGPGRDWKSPISWSTAERNLPQIKAQFGVTLEDIREAIVFYTATVPTVSRETVAGVAMVRVTADGYRNGPAGAVDITARLRGHELHRIRFGLRHRHEDGKQQRRHRREEIRREIRHLREYGPGPVEPITTCGGWVSVPETFWPAVGECTGAEPPQAPSDGGRVRGRS